MAMCPCECWCSLCVLKSVHRLDSPLPQPLLSLPPFVLKASSCVCVCVCVYINFPQLQSLQLWDLPSHFLPLDLRWELKQRGQAGTEPTIAGGGGQAATRALPQLSSKQELSQSLGYK